MIDHVNAMMEQNPDSEWPDEFPVPDIPAELFHVWEWFWEIRAGVPSGMAGVEPMSHVEILSWATMAQIDINPRILRYLRILDNEFLLSSSKLKK